MPWVAAAIIGSAVVGGVVASKNASNAASSQREGLDNATLAQIEAGDRSLTAQLAAGDRSLVAQLEAAGMGAEALMYAADRSAQAVSHSAEVAANTQWKMYDQTREDQLPWLTAGQGALKTLGGMMEQGPGEFKESPGYKFRLEQGNDNILGAASATGGLASGRTLKALTEYGQDYASNEYNNFLQQYYQSLTPYQSMAGMGQTTATNLGQQGNMVAANVAGGQRALGNSLASIYQNQGIATASGYQQTGDAISNNAMNTGSLLANSSMNTGNLLANQAMGQGNISAGNSIAQSNAWTNAINQGMTGLGMYYGNTQGYNTIGDNTLGNAFTSTPNPGYDFY